MVDPDGLPVVGATIDLVPAAGAARQTTSNSRGDFLLAAVPAGASTLRVQTPGSADGRNLSPETDRQFEIGQRFEFAGGRAVLSNAVYEILKRNVAIARGGGLFDQAGQQRSRGLELELTGEPVRALHVTSGYGYTRAQFPYFISGTTDPYRLKTGEALPVRVLFRGTPAASFTVTAASPATEDRTQHSIGRTDANGRINVPVASGKWRLHVIQMERSSSPDAEWESFWATLTFEVP